MMNPRLLAVAALCAAAPAALADITYISQTREVNSATSEDGGGIPLTLDSISTLPIAAPDFGPFNERSETSATDKTGWSEQHSSLLGDRVTFSGLTGGENNSASSFFGQAWGTSILTTEFSIANPSDFFFTFDADTVVQSQNTTAGSDAFGHARLLDASDNEVFSYLFNRLLTWEDTYTITGSLPAGTYRFEFDMIAGQGGGGHHQVVYSGQLVVPGASTASAVLIPALCVARRRRR